MAVTGVFTADFSNFDKAVEQSDARLKALEGTGTKVESSLRLMTQSQEAMLDKIGAAGGRFDALGGAAERASGQLGGVTETYHQFDGVLKTVGLNLGPAVAGFADIGAAAAGGAAALGTFGTAAVVAGTALASWKLGRIIADFLGLDEAINKASVSFQNLVDQTDLAKQDTINRAIAQGAKETIGYTEAIKFNTEAAKVNADAKINWTQKLADAYKEVRNVNDATKEEIAIAMEANATTEQLTNKYGLSATALGILATQHRDAAKATDEHRAAQEKLNKDAAAGLADFQAQTDVMNAWKPIIDENIKKRDAAAIATANQRAAELQHAEATAAETKATTDYLTEQDRMTAENDAAVAQLNAMAGAHTEAGAAAAAGTTQAVQGYQAAAQQITITGDAMKAYIDLMRYTAQAQAILGEGHLFTTQSQRDRVAAIPSFAGGVENFEGGLAKVHAGELLVNLPGGTSVIPKGQGGNLTMSNTFNLVDSESNLARRVSELIMRSVRAGTQIGTA